MTNDKQQFNFSTLTPDFELNPVIETGKYGKIRQDSVINTLSLVSSNMASSISDFANDITGHITIGNKTLSLEVIIQKYGNTTLKQSTSKLLTLLNMEFTQNGATNTSIAIPLRDVADRLGMKNINKARETIKKDLEALYNLSLEAQKKAPNGKVTDFIKFRICQGQKIENSIVYFAFTEPIAEHLRKGNIMPVSYRLLQIESNKQKNPYAYPLGLKITQLMKMNQFNNETHKPNTTCIISVSRLLEVCHNYGMPTYEELATGTRNYEKQIITPLIRDLDRLAEEKIFKWDFCKSKGELLTEEELDTFTAKDYINIYVKITYPEDYERDEYDTKKARKSNKETGKSSKNKKQDEMPACDFTDKPQGQLRRIK